MSASFTGVRRILMALVGVTLGAARLTSAQAFDPALQFRSLATAHFTLHFHQQEEADATRLARIVEETWTAVSASLGPAPPHTHVILVDQTDAANGWATPLPRNTVMVTAARPSGVEFIGSTDDWLRLVFTHEFTHIVHLDRSRSWARAVRHVFGRTPLALPNLWLPGWMVEGIATFEESAVTSQGRLHAGDFRAIVESDARAGGVAALDRINGGLVAWPSGNTPYVYGLGFHAYLAQRFGPASLARLADRTAGDLPYFWPLAFRTVYGTSLGRLWDDYGRDMQTRVASADAASRAAGRPTATPITHDGFVVSGPRFVPSSCAACAPTIVYASQNAHEFPALFEQPLDAPAARRKLTDRHQGDTVGISGSRIVFDQSELVRNARVANDLYVYDRTNHAVRRLTTNARLSDPDVAPDGTRVVAVQAHDGRRDLVVLPLAPAGDRRVIASGPDVQFHAPRWSPDGRLIAAERQRLGAYSEIVVVELATGEERVVAATPRTRWVTPAWRPDGGAVIAAADFNEQPFNLYEIALDGSGARQLTDTLAGATWPDVSPDGRTLVYVGYSSRGFDLFTVPYGPGVRTIDVTPARLDRVDRSPVAATAAAVAAAAPYRPASSLLPTSWLPLLESSNGAVHLGALVTGSDVLERHAYAVSASWLVSRPADVPHGAVNVPDAAVSYAYTRRLIQPWLAASRETSFYGALADDRGTPRTATVIERRIEAGATRVIRRVRAAQALQVSFVRALADIATLEARSTSNRSAWRASWAANTARTYGYSISQEHGVSTGVTAEFVRPAFGADGSATIWTADARAYLPGLGRHHVTALRAGGGATHGDAQSGRVFLLGGSNAAPSPASYDSEAFSLLRGFDANTFAGTHIVNASAEYRLPLVGVERGSGTLPFFLRTLHATAFLDAGHAWTRHFTTNALKISAGAELAGDVVLGYWLPLTTTVGAAFGHDGSGVLADGWRVYARVGRAF